ncbi:MAG: alpha-L-rhamnosidase N-terminal domain-containing protein, partial [Oscillospiraceae bacterium]|nr:alpha-L-rhamnosidase N-terminal domain-containing protein [Oscillospiraceae bacterium]
MKAINLKTEYLIHPIGLGIEKPRFFWNCEGGIKQTAYQILVKKESAVLWDSGKIFSNQMTHIRYEGVPLQSRDKIEWCVKLWDENDIESEWATSWFELGLLNEKDWKAKWISGNYIPKKNTRYPVDCFKKEFFLNKKIKMARLYITACGLYKAEINGMPAGDFCLAPGSTDYRYRLQYQTYDVTELLKDNENVLEIQLADGWYRGSIGCFGQTNVFGRQTKLLCQLEITHFDGTQTTIVSDESFLWSNDGPIRFA